MTAEITKLETPIRTRLPVPRGMEAGLWQVLVESVWPQASADAILLALRYCAARKLDPVKRPVHIVRRWNQRLGKFVETLQPGIAELELTAARTGEYAGLDTPAFGPPETRTFKGRVKQDQAWKDQTVTVTFPVWCERTVWRLVKGEKRAFTERVVWLEEYQTMGRGNELPVEMWARRPYDQFAKVAKAASLRAAFPEEQAGPTIDEVGERDILEDDEQPPEQAAQKPPAKMAEPAKPEVLLVDPQVLTPQEGEGWPDWGKRFVGVIRACSELTVIEQWMARNIEVLDQLKREKPKMHSSLMKSIADHRLSLVPAEDDVAEEETFDDADSDR